MIYLGIKDLDRVAGREATGTRKALGGLILLSLFSGMCSISEGHPICIFSKFLNLVHKVVKRMKAV